MIFASTSAVNRRMLATAVTGWIAINVIISVLAWQFALGDSPVIHTTRITLTQLLVTSGSVVSPPLILMLLTVVLLGLACSRRVWLSRISVVLLIAGIALVAWDTAGGLSVRAPGYDTIKWNAAVAAGWAYVALSALVIIACALSLIQTARHRPAPVPS